jgi:Sortase domain
MNAHARHGHRYVAVAGVLLAAAGLTALGIGRHGQQSAPRPPAPAPAAAAAPSTSDGAPSTPDPVAARGPVLPAAQPTHLSIPAIAVDSDVHDLGINPDRTVQVPPLGQDSWAGWYRYSPAPGQLGPSIMLGHIDSARYGPGVFFRLGALRPQDTVSITRADHTVAVFRIERVVRYAKAHFPTAEVYGNTDRAALRLITCGGTFDPSVRSYEDNIVAYAALVSSHRG